MIDKTRMGLGSDRTWEILDRLKELTRLVKELIGELDKGQSCQSGSVGQDKAPQGQAGDTHRPGGRE